MTIGASCPRESAQHCYASRSLGDVGELAARLVERFVGGTTRRRTLHDRRGEEQLLRIATLGLDFMAMAWRELEVPTSHEIDDLRNALMEGAREGIPLDVAHGVIREVFEQVSEVVVRQNDIGTRDSRVVGVQVLFEACSAMTKAISGAYIEALGRAVDVQFVVADRLVRALLNGCYVAGMAREHGVAIADAYHVVAVAVPDDPDTADPAPTRPVIDHRTQQSVHRALAATCVSNALSLLSAHGGTLLIPEASSPTETLISVARRLSRDAGIDVTATWTTAASADLVAAVERVHDLLDLLERTHRGPGIHCADELTLEHQLMQPSLAQTSLAEMLRPLQQVPRLFETLETFIESGCNRIHASRRLYIHPSTLDYRLRRVHEVIGIDPKDLSSNLRLYSALIAWRLDATPPAGRLRRPGVIPGVYLGGATGQFCRADGN
ncbi:PucR family transcriptional regulator [Nocardia nova]|uniref:PucR family transcriptional regulator n=1 Tax=Nocardia nova TaxID=37330 RepID=UPI003406007F